MSDLSERGEADEAGSGSVTEDETEESGPDFQLSPPEGFGGPGTESSEPSSSSDDSMEADDAGSDSEDESGDDESEQDDSVSI